MTEEFDSSPKSDEERKVFGIIDKAAVDSFGNSENSNSEKLGSIARRWKKMFREDGYNGLEFILLASVRPSYCNTPVIVDFATRVITALGWTELLQDRGPDQGGGKTR